MTLDISKIALEQAIRQAFVTINSVGSNDGSNPDSNIQALAFALATAIHMYVKSANVDITQIVSTVPPGTPVSTAGVAGPAAGTTVGPAIATHVGFGKLL